MITVQSSIGEQVRIYVNASGYRPLFILGDALMVLSHFPAASIDFCMTSPPYWRQRQYVNGGIGFEATPDEYIAHLLAVFAEVWRVLKPTGSFWLNLGDTYRAKRLLGLPWRVALTLMDEQGWILRNSVIWHKVKGGLDQSKDRLRNTHENLFHFVKQAKGYYYDVDAIRTAPRQARVVNDAVVSATGVKGIRYRRQIELSTALNEQEKRAALAALTRKLDAVRNGEIADFRMIIRKQQRPTHSDSVRVSGRARELHEKGFYFLTYHPKGSKPGDVWDILPEDTHKRQAHFSAYPEDLCKIPLLATCPPAGVALDPFCGTGTTSAVAQALGRKSIGIDISEQYLQIATERTWRLL